MKPFALLFCCACAFGQPQLDSIFVFEDLRGYFTDAAVLPDGDILLGGYEFSNQSNWTLFRMTPERTIVWQRGVPSETNPFGPRSFLLSGNEILSIASQYVQIDSNSGTMRDVVVVHTVDGDSLWADDYDDVVNNSKLISAAPDGHGGYVLLGYEYVRNGETWNQQVRLLRVDSTGVMLWERFFGGEYGDDPGAVLKLDGDSLLVCMMLDEGQNDRVMFMWTNLDGDSLGGRHYLARSSLSGFEPPWLYRRGSAIELVWPTISSTNSTETFYWLQTDEEGNVLFELERATPVNAVQGIKPSPDGLLIAGFSPWSAPERDAVMGRINLNGVWYYNEELDLPLWQEAYGYLTEPSNPLILLGRTIQEDFTSNACFFYLHANFHESYLFATPAQLNFGVVPQHEAAVRTVSLFVSADSSVTVTEITAPEFIATSLETPVTIEPGDSVNFDIAFRADELQIYSDTVHVLSTALNFDLEIPVTGQAPFPVCTPTYRIVNFFWVRVGDSLDRPLGVRNTGTIPLHIEPLEVELPFSISEAGPFTVEPDSSHPYWFTFSPDSEGDFRDTVLLVSDDPQGPDTVVLAGRGIAGPVNADEQPELPREFVLHPVYPNPFNATAVLEFELPRSQNVALNLYDVTGRLVKELAARNFEAGRHRLIVDGTGLASGIYFATITAGELHGVQKMVLLK